MIDARRTDGDRPARPEDRDDDRDLVIEHLRVERSGSPIVHDVSLRAPAGKISVLLGSNGAGKTTLLEGLSGVVQTTEGSVRLAGRELLVLPRRTRAVLGLAHVEQGRTIFPDLTVQQNLLVAAPRERLPAIYEIFPSLAERRDLAASHLSGGEQQMLVIGRALALEPRCVLIDEISLGLAPAVIERLLPVVRLIADGGAAVLLVEQFADVALRLADRAFVLSKGRVVFSGDGAALREDPSPLERAYLGGAGDGVASAPRPQGA